MGKYLGDRPVELSRKDLILIVDGISRLASQIRSTMGVWGDLARRLQPEADRATAEANLEAARELYPKVAELGERLAKEANRKEEDES